MNRLVAFCFFCVASFAILSCSSPIGGPSVDTTQPTQTSPDSPSNPASTDPVKPALSSDASLSSLAISVGILTPAFSPDVLDYTATVDTSFPSITLTGKAASDKAKLDATNGTAQALADGVTTLTYTVTAEDGVTKKTYTVAVTKAEDTTEPDVLFTVSTPTIDTTDADATVKGTIILEDPSGIQYVTDGFSFSTPDSSDTNMISLVKNEAASTTTRVVYDWSLTMPKGSVRGNYELNLWTLEFSDTRTNTWQYNYYNSKLNADSDTSFTITGTGDVTGPTYKNDSFIVTGSDTTTEPGNYIISGKVTFMDPSGVSKVYTDFVYLSGYGGRSGPVFTKNEDESSLTETVFDWSFTVEDKWASSSVSIYDLYAVDNYSNPTVVRMLSFDITAH